MQTPFFGFSIISHLMIILFGKLIYIVYGYKIHEAKVTESPIVHEYVNIGIMVVVFITILLSAGSIVTLSINNEYSTANLFDNYLDEKERVLI